MDFGAFGGFAAGHEAGAQFGGRRTIGTGACSGARPAGVGLTVSQFGAGSIGLSGVTVVVHATMIFFLSTGHLVAVRTLAISR